MNLTRTAIHRPVTVFMFVIAVILFGVVSLERLPLNLLPEISYPSLTIRTEYPDTGPVEIESLVTRPIEEQVGVVPGLRRLSSTSRSGESEVVLEFAWDTNMDLASLDVREKLDLIVPPEDAEKSVILRFDPSYDPIMRVQLFGEQSLSRLRYLADKDLKQGLESTEGVGAVKVAGGREEQIHVEIDEKRLAELGVPITQVTNILRQENLNQASGSLYDQDARYMVRMLNEFNSVDEIERIIIRDDDGRKLVLGDLARVWRGTKEREIIARLNSKESVELAIYKEGDANTVTVSKAVQAKLKALAGAPLFPKDVSYEVVFDQASFITQSVNNVLMAAIIGGVLAILILYIFLRDPRSTVIIAASIPISIMATFALMYQTGITLNIMSLGGVALGVGMLVDNSIVVLESVHRHRRAGGALAEAVYRGTKEVGMAVTASTLTTVAVFLPLVFVEGIAGQLFKDQALTITYSLLASLLVALTVIPMLLALRVNRGALEEDNAESAEGQTERAPVRAHSVVYRDILWLGRTIFRFLFVDLVLIVATDVRRGLRALGRGLLFVINPALGLFERWFDSLTESYSRALHWALNEKALVFTIVIALVGLSAIAYPYLGAELIPPLAQGEFSFEIEFPDGTPIETTDRALADIENRVREIPAIATVFSNVGGSNRNQFSQSAVEEHIGQLHLVMKDRRDRSAEERAIGQVRQELSRYPEISYLFSRPTLFSFKTPVEVEIFSFDLEAQSEAAELVAARLAGIEGLSDIQTTTRRGSPEIQVRFRRDVLARLGLDETRISEILRNKIRGEVASRYREEEKQIEILVRAEESDRDTIADLTNLVINDQGGAAGTTGGQGSGPGSQPAQQNTQNQNTGSGDDDDEGNQATSQEPAEEQTARTIPIRLGAVADIRVGRGPAEVRRIRSQRAAIVSANLTGRDLHSVAGEIRAQLAELRTEVPVNTVIGLGGQNEELEESYGSLQFALALAVFLVYLVMASQFESLIHPFVILFTVPLALVGVVLSLALTGTTISVMVLLGVIILAGIVVNNAIVLVDYTNQLRERGIAKRTALVQAGQVRLRPIVMTTLTTVLGLFPMALGWGEGSEVRAPMAIAVMGGLLFSTMLTLLLIPVVYELVDRKVYAPADSTATAEPPGGDVWGTPLAEKGGQTLNPGGVSDGVD